MIYLTEHGGDRVIDRLGLPDRRVKQSVANAYARGKRKEDFEGLFREYLDRKEKSHGKTEYRVYARNVYVFVGRHFVTMWPVPERFLEEHVVHLRLVEEQK